jgi:hypothetical protein
VNPERLARFVRKWLAEWETEPPAFGHATKLLNHLIEYRPSEAWERILALVSQAKEESLCYVGAGPLEDLLIEHGDSIIDRVEATAAADPRFARCLSVVRGWSRIEPSVYARVQRTMESTSRPTTQST